MICIVSLVLLQQLQVGAKTSILVYTNRTCPQTPGIGKIIGRLQSLFTARWAPSSPQWTRTLPLMQRKAPYIFAL